VTGEIEEDGGVLIIRRIHVVYHLAVPVDAEQRETVDRLFETHPRGCPVYRSLHPQIQITTELRLETPEGAGRHPRGGNP
jgi:uncharacterized OsmC-like protein